MKSKGRWKNTLVRVLRFFAGSPFLVYAVNQIAQEKIDQVEDEKRRATWQFVKDIGVQSVQIVGDNNLDNKGQFETLARQNSEAIFAIGIVPFVDKARYYVDKKMNGKISMETKLAFMELFNEMIVGEQDFDIVEYMNEKKRNNEQFEEAHTDSDFV